MGLFCSSQKLLTTEHHTKSHWGQHNEKNCQNNHCTIEVTCTTFGCFGRYNVCSDCLRINRIYEIRCKRCWTKLRLWHLLSTVYSRENERWLSKHHDCNNFLKTEWVGRNYCRNTGEQFTRCTLCYKSRCYKCGQYAPKPGCSDCDNYYNPTRICEHCHHTHKKGEECKHVTTTTGTVNNPSYYIQNGLLHEIGGSSSINLTTKCGCDL